MQKNELTQVFEKIDANLKDMTLLRIIGGAAMLMLGSDRSTRDIDVHLDKSKFSPATLRQACENADIDYNPDGANYIENDRPYIEIVPDSENFNFPKTTADSPPDTTLWKGLNLKVLCPPPEDLLVSKIRRFDTRDIQDIAFLDTLIPEKEKTTRYASALARLPLHTRKDILFKENLEMLAEYYLPSIKNALKKRSSAPTR